MKVFKFAKNRVELVVLLLLVAVTIARVVLGALMPLYFQPNAGYDDWLFVRYAKTILEGTWLGPFDGITLAKSASFSLLLVGVYLSGIPYPLALMLFFVAACVCMSLAVCTLTSNKHLSWGCYLFLLFSPVMFHVENAQKIYRGGFIIIFALFVFAFVIGMYANRKEERPVAFCLWGCLGVFSLPIFWLMKEDSVWVLPFVGMGLACTVFGVVRSSVPVRQRVVRVLVCALPLVALVVSVAVYKQANERAYSIRAVNDKTESAYSDVIHDLLVIDDPAIGEVWVTHDMVRRAMAVSPTLNSMAPELEAMFESGLGVSDGEIPGDIIAWSLREAFARSDVYSSGAHAQEVFGKIHQELQAAFDSGELKQQKGRLFVSRAARGFTPSELAELYAKMLPTALLQTINYASNTTTMDSFDLPSENLQFMEEITRCRAVALEEGSKMRTLGVRALEVSEGIVAVYRVVSPVIAVLAVAGYGVLVARAVRDEDKQRRALSRDVLLVSAGLLLSAFALVAAVCWFASFLDDRKVYDYICAIIPLVQVCQTIGLAALVSACLARKGTAGSKRLAK